MAGNKKPRKKYRPRPVLLNTMEYAMEGVNLITNQEGYLVDLKIKNQLAFGSALTGRASFADLTTLITAHAITEAFWAMGRGREYKDILIRSQVALREVWDRLKDSGRSTLRAPELQAFRDLLELHDAMLEVATVNDMEEAIKRAKDKKRANQSKRPTAHP